MLGIGLPDWKWVVMLTMLLKPDRYNRTEATMRVLWLGTETEIGVMSKISRPKKKRKSKLLNWLSQWGISFFSAYWIWQA